MKPIYSAIAAACLLTFSSFTAQADPCSFDTTKTCTLFRDILNDTSPQGLHYFGPTNYDHRISGEINVFDSALVQPYCDAINKPGQLKLIGVRMGPNAFNSGEIMTRSNLDKPPYNSPNMITPFTTKDISHGYVEAVVKLPKCETSDDGLCQNNTAPTSYNRGLWPSVWMLPTMDTNWPQNGEIDIFEAYQLNRDFNVSTATLHFNGNDPRCGGNDCKFIGFPLAAPAASGPLYNDFHSWGFEWQPDPNSTKGGVIMTGYFDNMKIWGPLATDSLPADGPNAMSRGFNDPNGGFYLIAALAIGGPYAGAPNAHLITTSMYVQSIKAFSVGGVTPPPTCPAPVNIKSLVSADKKQVTFSWQEPATTETILNYQVNDGQNNVKWKGTSRGQRCYTDLSLPGTPGSFTYLFYTNCASGLSPAATVNLTT